MTDGVELRTDRQSGAVTFLDVLGWKGIWGREADAIGSLQSLIVGIEKNAREIGRGRGNNVLSTRTISISDTIVLVMPATRDDATAALVLHGELCATALPDSIMKGIPIRGASSFGQYEMSGNGSIFLGAAIDEAASWHEHSDWIGVHMAPSARFFFGEEEKEPWCRYLPPYKDGPFSRHTQ